jgi:hypothetical protein
MREYISSPKQVATNQKANKTFKTLSYSLFPVPCSLKSLVLGINFKAIGTG